MDYFEKDQPVKPIMLEVNKSLYMNEVTGENSKSFQKVKNLVKGFLKLLDGSKIEYTIKE